MTVVKQSESEVLARQGGRAVRHFFVFYFGIPAFLLGAGTVFYNFMSGLAEGEILRSIVFLAIFGTLTVLFGRWLWRLVKK